MALRSGDAFSNDKGETLTIEYDDATPDTFTLDIEGKTVRLPVREVRSIIQNLNTILSLTDN